MKVTVVGLGYVGLVTAACLARLGHRVVGLEKDPAKLEQLNLGRVPYHEPGLDDVLERHWRSGYMSLTSSAADAIDDPDIVLICVGTPSDATGKADLTA